MLDGNLFQVKLVAKDPAIKFVRGQRHMVVKPDFASLLDIECVVRAGWVNMLKVVSPGLIYLRWKT